DDLERGVEPERVVVQAPLLECGAEVSSRVGYRYFQCVLLSGVAELGVPGDLDLLWAEVAARTEFGERRLLDGDERSREVGRGQRPDHGRAGLAAQRAGQHAEGGEVAWTWRDDRSGNTELAG